MKWLPSILAFGSGVTPSFAVLAKSGAEEVEMWVRIVGIVVGLVLAIFQKRKNGRSNERQEKKP